MARFDFFSGPCFFWTPCYFLVLFTFGGWVVGYGLYIPGVVFRRLGVWPVSYLFFLCGLFVVWCVWVPASLGWAGFFLC